MANPLRVLVVDDEERPRIHLEDLVSGRGHELTAASSLEEAVAALDQGPFDLVVMDLCIPVRAGRIARAEHGYELERQVRARLPRGETYLIVVTGVGLGAMDSSRAHDHGCDAYVLKGDWERLTAKLAEGEAQAHARVRPAGTKRTKTALPLKAKTWQDCSILLGSPITARIRSGSSAIVEPSEMVEKVLYHLQFSEEGSDLRSLTSESNRRSLARDARNFLRAVFEVKNGPKDPLPYQRARKAWISLVRLRERDLDEVRGAYEEVRRRDHDTFEDAS